MSATIRVHGYAQTCLILPTEAKNTCVKNQILKSDVFEMRCRTRSECQVMLCGRWRCVCLCVCRVRAMRMLFVLRFGCVRQGCNMRLRQGRDVLRYCMVFWTLELRCFKLYAFVVTSVCDTMRNQTSILKHDTFLSHCHYALDTYPQPGGCCTQSLAQQVQHHSKELTIEFAIRSFSVAGANA